MWLINEEEKRGAEWWSEQFGAQTPTVSFSQALFPALWRACQAEHPTLGATVRREEVAVIVKYALAASAWQQDRIIRSEFLCFLARFGPLPSTIPTVLTCFTTPNAHDFVPWFHGALGRSEAFHALLSSVPSQNPADGTYLVRYSESQPKEFVVTYVKIHRDPPRVGEREFKNSLIKNLGPGGFVLAQPPAGRPPQAYTSIRQFIECYGARLRQGVSSPLAEQCNSELRVVRARLNAANDGYTQFSSETIEPMSPVFAQKAHDQLFEPTVEEPEPMPMIPPLQISTSTFGNQSEQSDYSVLSKDTFVLASPSSVSSSSEQMSETMSGYGKLSAANVLPQSPVSNSRLQAPTPPSPSRRGTGFAFSRFPLSPASRVQSNQSDFSDSYAPFAQIMGQTTSLSSVGTPPRGNPRLDYCSNPYGNFDNTGSEPSNSTADTSNPYGNFFPSTLRRDSPQVVRESTSSLAQSDPYGSFTQDAISSAQEQSAPGSAFINNAQSKSDPYGSFDTITNTSQQLVSDSESSTPIKFDPAIHRAADPYGSFTQDAISPQQLQQYPAQTTANESRKNDEFPHAEADPYGNFNSIAISPRHIDTSDPYGSFAPAVASSQSQQLNTKPDEPNLPSQRKSDSVFFPETTEQASEGDSEMKPSVPERTALDELNAGMDFYKRKQLSDALLCFRQAKKLAQVNEDRMVEARALGNLGTVYLDQRNPQKAVKYYTECLEITHKINDVKRERTILNNLVLALMASEDFDSAYEYSLIQFDKTSNQINRQKIQARMSLLKEKANRAKKING